MIKLNPHQKKVLAQFPKFDEVQLARLKKDPVYLRAYVSVCLEDYAKNKDVAQLKNALGVVVRALGATQVARHTQRERTSLYRSFSARGNPSMASFLGVLDCAGIDLMPAVPRKYQ